VNTTFLDFPDQAKCQKAAAAMNTSERVDIRHQTGFTGTRSTLKPCSSPRERPSSSGRMVQSVELRAMAWCSCVFDLISEPFGGAPQVVMACLDKFGGDLGVLRDRRHEEAFLSKMAVIRSAEICAAGVTLNSVAHGRCATRFGGPCVAEIV
jgi:hypothetical protein